MPRPRLVDTIQRSVANARLALVSAPAGYGKTTLVANAVSQLPNTKIAWLTLDSEDDEPLRFLGAFAAALQPLTPAFTTLAMGILAASGRGGQGDPLATGRAMMTALVNELFEGESPICLVRDDLHYVSHEAIHDALNFLIERLPPHVTLVIATRHDPSLALAQLRARRELVELRLEELRFTADETVALLNQHFGLSLSSSELTALLQRTEGWAAGMTWITASLQRIQNQSARSAFFEQIANSNRYLFDYLAEAVLGREEQATCDFLVATSILEVLTPTLCAAVTGRTDAAQMLERLYHRNLFLNELDQVGSSAQASYRYHDLFRNFLRERVQRTAVETAHEWHRRAARAADQPDVRIYHFLHAEDWAAADTIEQSGQRLINENAWQQLIAWIKRLPVPLVESRPRLDFLLGLIATARWDLETAVIHLQRAIKQFEAQTESSGLGEALVALTVAYNLLGDAGAAAAAIERTLALPISAANRVLLLTGRIWQRSMTNDAAQVRADLDEAMDLIEASGDHQALSYLATGFRASVLSLPGCLERGERFVRLAGTLSRESNVITQASLLFLQAVIAMWRDDWEAVKTCCSAVAEISERMGGFVTIGVEAEAQMNQAMQLAISGDWAQAEPAFVRYFEVQAAQKAIQRDWQLGTLNIYARACWMNNQVDALKAVYHQMESVASTSHLPFKAILVDEIKALLLLTEGQANAAMALLQTVVANRPPTPILRLFGQASFTLAYACLQAGDRAAALKALAPALEVIERENIPGQLRFQGPTMVIPLLRLAVEKGGEKGEHSSFAAKMLARLDPDSARTETTHTAALSTPFRIPDTGEILTEREIEVLRLIARGVDNATIASEMIVSIHTVKTHVAHILGKLGVSSRMAAAIKARELGLVK